MRYFIWSMRRMLRCPYQQVYGSVVYENYEVFSYRKAYKLSAAMPPSALRAQFHYLSSCSAVRMGGILVVAQPALMTIFWAVLRPFMSAKLRARVRLLGTDLNALAEECEPALLPPEFGGSLQEDAMAWFDEQCALEAAGR